MKIIISQYIKEINCNDFYITPKIPANKIFNAFGHYLIPREENIVALLDATVFGSAKNGMAFCNSGIFWRNDWTTETSKQHLTWEELLNSHNEIVINGNDLILPQECAFNMSGCSLKPIDLKKYLIEIILNINSDQSNVNIKTNSQSTNPTKINSKSEIIESKSINTIGKNSAPNPNNPFKGKYDKKILQIVNNIAENHRLGSSVYIAPKIPVNKVKRILEACGNSIEPFDIFVIVDNTFLGTCTDFLAVTKDRICAKSPLEKFDEFKLEKIRTLHSENRNLYINDHKFQHFDQLTDYEPKIISNFLHELIPELINAGNPNKKSTDKELSSSQGFINILIERGIEELKENLGNEISKEKFKYLVNIFKLQGQILLTVFEYFENKIDDDADYAFNSLFLIYSLTAGISFQIAADEDDETFKHCYSATAELMITNLYTVAKELELTSEFKQSKYIGLLNMCMISSDDDNEVDYSAIDEYLTINLPDSICKKETNNLYKFINKAVEYF